MASVSYNGKPLTHDVVVDETWFSDPVLCEEKKIWYRLSKTLAEEAAWKFAKERGIDMVTIHPGQVIGPFLQPNINLTVDTILNHIKDDPKKTQHLRGFDGAEERLQLFKANLMEDGDYDTVVDGCEGVFHVASPVILAPKDPQNELIGPALNGTLNVLRSCAKVPSIKRVVLTSSMATVAFNGKPLTHGVVVDETWFSDPVFCEENKLWYHLSKALAEKAAWKFAKESGIDIVTIHPGWVIGPIQQPNINLTVETILNHIKGTVFPNEVYRFVDVRDVAYAHILAYERASARGRYCIVGNVTHLSEFLDILHQHFPTLRLPQKCADEKPFVAKYEVSQEKVRTELGLEYTSLEVTVKDTIQCFKERGFLHF